MQGALQECKSPAATDERAIDELKSQGATIFGDLIGKLDAYSALLATTCARWPLSKR
jgi:hypothetical protein